MKKKLLITLLMTFTGILHSQAEIDLIKLQEKTKFTPVSNDSNADNFTGILAFDSRMIKSDFNNQNIQQGQDLPGKKSPLLAGLMSLAVPGAGEIYAKNYWKPVIFLAIEATAIAVNVIYNKKGDDKTVEFENYANENWSAVKYADWLNRYTDHLGLDAPDIVIDQDVTKEPWERVDFKKINEVEDLISNFSHKLEPHGAQQYYELIGKYFQYKPGWADYNTEDFDYWNFNTNMFVKYSDMFLEPDRIYQVASTAVIVIITNHFLSAIDAAWTASRYNKKLTASMEMKQKLDVTGISYYPQLNFQYRF